MDTTPDFYFDSVSQVRMSKLHKGRVVLLGDAGYCPSPASGQGTSLALVGAYVLAGEMIKRAGNHSDMFTSYQAIMQPYIDANQQLANTALKGMIPGSKVQLYFQNFMLRLLLKLPRRHKIFRGMFRGMQRAVNQAAQGIELTDY